MNLQQAITLARHSELQQLSIADDDEAVVGLLNLGLIELHKRFQLTTEEYVIPLETGVIIYTMPTDFMYLIEAYREVPAANSDTSTSPYEAYTRVPINDENNPDSINTVAWNRLQIPMAYTGSYIGTIYVPKPVYLSTTDMTQDLGIPDTLIDSLMLFVGYKGHTAVSGAVQGEGNTHYMRFEASINKLKLLGIGVAPDDSSITNRINSRGFV